MSVGLRSAAAAIVGAIVAGTPAASGLARTADSAEWRELVKKAKEVGQISVAGLPDDIRCSFQTAEWVMTDPFVNTGIVNPGEIMSGKDQLKPQYKGKSAAYDRRDELQH